MESRQKIHVSLFLSLFFSFIFSLSASAQTGIVKGTIHTSDGKPAEFVNVILKEIKKGTVTDANGAFILNNIKEGNYTITTSFVGLKTQEKQITVVADQTLILAFTLEENAKQLNEVVITASRSLNEKQVTIGKLPIKPFDLPQSVVTLDKDVLERQQSVRLSDAIKNINGVYIMSTTGGTQEELAGRGFAFSSSNTFKNGARYNNSAMPEMSSLERIEVMKGSNAILYGNVAAGGIINLVTKKPQFENGGELSMRVGSYGFYKPSLDIYGAFNNSSKAAYRVNTTYETANSFRDEVSSERFYINPSFLFKLGKKTDILLEGDYLKDGRTNDYGTGAVNYELANVPRNQFLGAKWSYSNITQKSATATITHQFNNNWQLRSTSAYQNYANDLFTTTRPNASNNFVKTDGKWIRGVQRTQADEDYYITQLDLTGKFSTGFLKHALLFGADADKYTTNTTAFVTIAKYDSINIYDLSKYKQRNDIPNLDTNTLTKTPINRTGVYVQDLISITEKIKVLAGARFTYMETFGSVYTYKTKATTETKAFDHAVTPRFGLIYQPIKTMSLFASYANSFTLNTGVDVNGKPLAPSFIDQYEAGIKNELFKGLLSANVTVYQIKNSNLAQTSLENGNTNSNIKELAGEVTSKGLEVDVMSKQIHGFSFIAGYSYNETRYTRSNVYIINSLLRYNPNHTANASAYYTFSKNTFMKGFNLGATATYIGERQAGRSTRLNVANETYKLIPLNAYTLLDFCAGYTKDKYSVRAKVSNITNELNYNAHDDNSINPIAPRMFFATFAYKL